MEDFLANFKNPWDADGEYAQRFLDRSDILMPNFLKDSRYDGETEKPSSVAILDNQFIKYVFQPNNEAQRHTLIYFESNYLGREYATKNNGEAYQVRFLKTVLSKWGSIRPQFSIYKTGKVDFDNRMDVEGKYIITSLKNKIDFPQKNDLITYDEFTWFLDNQISGLPNKAKFSIKAYINYLQINKDSIISKRYPNTNNLIKQEFIDNLDLGLMGKITLALLGGIGSLAEITAETLNKAFGKPILDVRLKLFE